MLCLLVLFLAACLLHAVVVQRQLCMCHIAETATIVFTWMQIGQFLSAQVALCCLSVYLRTNQWQKKK